MPNQKEQQIKASSMCIDEDDSDLIEPIHLRTDISPLRKSGESPKAAILPSRVQAKKLAINLRTLEMESLQEASNELVQFQSVPVNSYVAPFRKKVNGDAIVE